MKRERKKTEYIETKLKNEKKNESAFNREKKEKKKKNVF